VECPGGDSCPRTPLMVQAANGARRDATLHTVHFDDGEHLNSLGRAKLDAMLSADRVNEPLTLYVDAPGFEGKKAAVAAYLKDKGAAETSFAIVEGSNPNVTFAAQPQIESLPKTDSAPPAGGGESPYGAAGAGVPPGGGVLSTVGAALTAVSK
jgi:hypothetical protein